MDEIDRHYEDEELAALAGTPAAEGDAHLRSCVGCGEKLEAFALIAEALHEGAVWDQSELRSEPNRSTIATLRAFAEAMEDEDAYAEEEVLPELLEGARETWMPRLRAHPEWQTAGVVRKLIEAASRAIDTMPADAVEMTALATTIAAELDENDYSADTVERLRGAAWRERAYTLFYTGSYADAEKAIFASERHFSECSVPEYELARLGIVRSIVLRAQEQASSAMSAARLSTATFLNFDDVARAASAQLAEVQVLFDRGEFEPARELLLKLERRIRGSADVGTHARVLGNLGVCCWKLNRINDALQYCDAAAVLFANLGAHAESARTQWQVATVLATVGRVEEAQLRFERVRQTFQHLGMAGPATLVSLDIAELMLARGQFDSVEAICRAAMRSFELAGIPYTARALTALAYMHEAARLRTATPALVKHVREYIRRLPDNTNLLFAPPAV
jgi:tetratricopeptide (TPR) repeat protein